MSTTVVDGSLHPPMLSEHTPPQPNSATMVVMEHWSESTLQIHRKGAENLVSRFPLETAALLSAMQTLCSTNVSSSKMVCSFALDMINKSCLDNAIHVFHVTHRLGSEINVSQCEGHTNSKPICETDCAKYCLERMQAARFKLSETTYITVLTTYRSLGPNEGVDT